MNLTIGCNGWSPCVCARACDEMVLTLFGSDMGRRGCGAVDLQHQEQFSDSSAKYNDTSSSRMSGATRAEGYGSATIKISVRSARFAIIPTAFVCTSTRDPKRHHLHACATRASESSPTHKTTIPDTYTSHVRTCCLVRPHSNCWDVLCPRTEKQTPKLAASVKLSCVNRHNDELRCAPLCCASPPLTERRRRLGTAKRRARTKESSS
jgi:hypothetical protein